MKINDALIEPISNFNFNNTQNNRVYFYPFENSTISLSNMFENCPKLLDFSANNEYMNNYIINDIKGILKKCISLKNVELYSYIFIIFI